MVFLGIALSSCTATGNPANTVAPPASQYPQSITGEDNTGRYLWIYETVTVDPDNLTYNTQP